MDSSAILNTLLGAGALTIIIVGSILLTSNMLARRIARAIPPDPFVQIASQTNVIGGTLALYERQIKALREQMDHIEADRKAQEQRMESEKHALFERVDQADALNRTLGEKLIAITDKYTALDGFIEHIYGTLQTTPGGAGWVVELRKVDPRRDPPRSGPPPVVNGQ